MRDDPPATTSRRVSVPTFRASVDQTEACDSGSARLFAVLAGLQTLSIGVTSRPTAARMQARGTLDPRKAAADGVDFGDAGRLRRHWESGRHDRGIEPIRRFHIPSDPTRPFRQVQAPLLHEAAVMAVIIHLDGMGCLCTRLSDVVRNSLNIATASLQAVTGQEMLRPAVLQRHVRLAGLDKEIFDERDRKLEEARARRAQARGAAQEVA